MSKEIIKTEINGLRVELQPIFGDFNGAVWHMLPGGTTNPEGFEGGVLLDVYASSALGRGSSRGGHYHLKLEEMFFTLSGTALWIFSDFRSGSPSFGKTVGLIVGIKSAPESHEIPSFILEERNALARLRVPPGVYHAYYPLTDERVVIVGLGSTPYVKEDYIYPKIEEVPGAKEILSKFNIQS